MKFLLIAFCLLFFTGYPSDVTNSVWTYKVANGCVDTLTLKPNAQATDYDCELNYTFHDSYMLKKDTLILTEKDDSHSEDGGRVIFSSSKFLIQTKALYLIGKGELIKGKWRDIAVKKVKSDWIRIK
jgi:hypothetical protein